MRKDSHEQKVCEPGAQRRDSPQRAAYFVHAARLQESSLRDPLPASTRPQLQETLVFLANGQQDVRQALARLRTLKHWDVLVSPLRNHPFRFSRIHGNTVHRHGSRAAHTKTQPTRTSNSKARIQFSAATHAGARKSAAVARQNLLTISLHRAPEGSSLGSSDGASSDEGSNDDEQAVVFGCGPWQKMRCSRSLGRQPLN